MDRDNSLQFLSHIAIENYFWDDNFKNVPNNKIKLCKRYMYDMLKRTACMFKWKGLPKEIPSWLFELNIQTCGFMGVIKEKDKLYSVYGGLGSTPNYNYMPTEFIVANPYLKINKIYQIYDTDNSKADCVIFPNDLFYEGLLPLCSYHAQLLTEINLTKKINLITRRMPILVTAPDNNVKLDIEAYFKQLEKGNIKAITSKSFIRDINAVAINPDNSAASITHILEMEQYQWAKFFNDIGMSMNYNMKRETITSSESQLGEDALYPLVDQMIDMRRAKCSEMKDVFDVKWEVDFDSSWWEENRKKLVSMLKDINELSSSTVQSTEQDNENAEEDNNIEEVQSTEQDNENAEEDNNIEEVQSTEQDNESEEEDSKINEITNDILTDIVEDIKNKDGYNDDNSLEKSE